MTILKMLERLTETVEEMDEDLRAAQEENEEKQFQIDEKDKQLSTLAMDIQLYCQKYYFGRLAENYFTDLHQDTADKTNMRNSKNMILLQNMPQKFDYARLCEIAQSNLNYAHVIVHRWLNDGLIKKIKSGKNIIFERI